MRSSSETGKVTSGRVSESPRPEFLKSLLILTLTWRARNILLILSGTCVARKKQITLVTGDGKHTENKEIYPSFKKSGDSGL